MGANENGKNIKSNNNDAKDENDGGPPTLLDIIATHSDGELHGWVGYADDFGVRVYDDHFCEFVELCRTRGSRTVARLCA